MGLFDRNRGEEPAQERNEEQQRAEEPVRREELEQRPDEQPTREQGPDREESGATAAAVKNEPAPTPAGDREDDRQREGEGDEYQWHTGRQRPHGEEDAVEFVEVHKAFGKNKILRGLNMGIPNNNISMMLGPSCTVMYVCF